MADETVRATLITHPPHLAEALANGLASIAIARKRPLVCLVDSSISSRTVEYLAEIKDDLESLHGQDVDVFIHSPGGGLTASYQVGRMVSRLFPRWTALVPFQATSGATLICLAAEEIALSDLGFLGPVDPQVVTHREQDFWDFEHRSSLEAFQALEYIREFTAGTVDLMMKLLLMQSVAPDVALRNSIDFAVRLTEPIAGRIDPYALGEFQRDTQLAVEYAHRLARPADDRRTQSEADVEFLVTRYPAHDFAIDREEAATLGFNVSQLDGALYDCFSEIRPELDNVDCCIGLIQQEKGGEPNDDHIDQSNIATDRTNGGIPRGPTSADGLGIAEEGARPEPDATEVVHAKDSDPNQG